MGEDKTLPHDLKRAMAKKKIVVFTAPDCTPCEQMVELIKQGNVDNPDIKEVEMVDISTDEGFDRYNAEVLSKLNPDEETGVPFASLDGKPCGIEIHDDTWVVFTCPKDGSPSSPGEKLSPSSKT